MEHVLLVAVSILIVSAMLWWARNRNMVSQLSAADVLAPKPLDTLFDRVDSTPDRPVGFGYKMSWLAIKAPDAATVRGALDIENVQPANWRTGLVAAYNGHAFISPRVGDWVFVLSSKLPELGHPPDNEEWTALMTDLSRTFDDVQYFSSHRVSDYNAWARFGNGTEVRAFAYCAETLVDRGDKTAGETELGYHYFDGKSADAGSNTYWEREDLCYPDEEHVMEIAGQWSVNPQSLDEIDLPHGSGWIGNLARDSKGVT